MNDVSAQVEAARRGDREAFCALVARFERMAVGCAYARLGDVELARDAAQEALLAAFLKLPQLREPAAFPGWLRRLVLTHCERQRRAPGRGVMGAGAEAVDPRPGPAQALETAQRDARLRAAVESLPAAQRAVVALYYFAGEPLERIAEFLELPETTLKKRLYAARRRLEREDLRMNEIGDEPPLASAGRTLLPRVRLFLALRAGDREEVGALLASDPDLVTATEDWSVDEALDGGLPVPTRATPLIRAAERGDLAMLDLLLDRGAPVDGSCRCITGESALFAALAAGREAVAARLLARGAEPNATAFAGTTPLHVAAIRGFETLVPALLARGADPSRRDANGRTAADWARLKGRTTIVSLLGAAPEGAALQDAPRTERPPWPLLATGIKAIDLFAPLLVGDLVRVVGGMRVGRNVLLAELSHVFAHRFGGRSLYAAWERRAWQEAELEELVAETGLAGSVALLRCAPGASEAEQESLARRALAQAEALQDEAPAPVLLAIFEEPGRVASVESLYTRLGRAARVQAPPATERAPLTVVLVAPLERAALEPPFPLTAPFDALLRLDPVLAERRLYPALDPAWARSRNLRPEVLGDRHCTVAREARALLGRARELDPTAGARVLEVFTGPERALVARARRLQAFLTQPFHVAESFSARPGASVEVAETVEGVASILAGEHDALAIERFAYRGGMTDVSGAELPRRRSYSSTSSSSESSPGTPIRSGKP
jgi:F-type H+-transporting ATPase subunit beta